MTVLDDMATRLAAAADEVDATKVARQAAIRQRNLLILEAADDHGMTQAQIAKHAKVTQPHVIRILAYSDDPAAAATVGA